MNSDDLFDNSIESGNYVLNLLDSKEANDNKKSIRNIYKLLTVVILENENDPRYADVKVLVDSIREKWADVFSDNIDALNSNNNNNNSNNNSVNNSNVNSRINNFNANTANFEGNNMGNANLGENNANSLPSAISNNSRTNMNNISGGRRRNNRKTKKSYRNKVSRKSRLNRR
jgi:hypothetical protein